MNLSVGIVGLPNVGKSTLFNALLKKQQALAANYPFATIEPNVGIVPVPDQRLVKLAEITKEEEKMTQFPPIKFATVEFVDIAGLVKGASEGAGLGNKFLSHIKEVSVICHVVRAFTDENIIREGSSDPENDFATIQTELILADLQTVKNVSLKTRKMENPSDKTALDKLSENLNNGVFARNIDFTEEEMGFVKTLFLLTIKEEIVVLNVNEDYSYIERYGESEEEKDLYEYKKLEALRELLVPGWNKNIFTTLSTAYSKYFLGNDLKLLERQKKSKKLDRFDLVILLKSYFEKYKKFEIKREYQTFVKHNLVRKTEKTLVMYSLMIIDEFQNYLPEQLQILKSCLNEKTQSVVYVGDMAQQVKLGTIRSWEDINEIISPDMNVRLNKVYRNTKNILSFIKNLGYAVELPVGLKEGPVVVEKITKTTEEEIMHIKNIVSRYSNGSIGILAKEESYLENFKKEFADIKNIHVLSMLEAQGVEFDLVCIVGVKNESFSLDHYKDMLPKHVEERKRMQKDLLYVALTRAITELHILGSEKLNDVFSDIL